MNKEFEDFITMLKLKKIAIIGAGVSNLPLIKLLKKNCCDIMVFDQKELSEMKEETAQYLKEENIPVSLGKDYLEKLVGFDYIFRSPSFLPTNPYLVREKNKGAVITTEVEQVIRLTRGLVIGITGSKGKTTTTTILNTILTRLGYSTYLGGNIGMPLFDKLSEMDEDDIIVLELSSFQLMDMNVSPHISVVTNISPDHLDIHSSYEEYIDAKKNILKNQTDKDILVLNYDDSIVRSFAFDAKGEVRYFRNISLSDDYSFEKEYVLDGNFICFNGENIIDTRKLLLKGSHNYLNICAALNAIKDYISVENSELEDIIKDIKSVNHRLEFVRELDGVKWYNDSASTTPDKSIAGLNAFSENIVLIAGGYDKNISYSPLANPILDKVSKLILFGDTKNKIYEEVMKKCRETGRNIPIYVMDTLEEVVEVAYRVSKKGEIVLFSPASASFDMFKNAYQRGDLYKEMVNKL